MASIIIIVIFFIIPIAALIYFVDSLVRYVKAKKKLGIDAESIDEHEFKERKTSLIVSSVIAGVLWAVIITFIVMFYFAIAYM